MPENDSRQPSGQVGSSARFHTTRWSVVLSAGDRPTSQSRDALATLCETYWYPLYAFTRREGYSPEQAEDLTQGFFERFLEKNYLGDVRRERGKFRSFLLASLKHYLSNQRDRDRALKRGGGKPILSLDAELAESQYRLDPGHDLTPDKVFERRWAMALLDRVLRRLQEEQEAAGKGEQFARLSSHLTRERGGESYREVAEHLGMTEGAVKVAVHRLRRRFRKVLREEISETVAGEDQIDEEIRDLFAALSS
jgi:RNA polymerase sigma-70 factor (ECF subfamily)